MVIMPLTVDQERRERVLASRLALAVRRPAERVGQGVDGVDLTTRNASPKMHPLREQPESARASMPSGTLTV